MEIWAIIFYITSILVIVIPLILCYKVFSKSPKGSCSTGMTVFCLIYTAPGYGCGTAGAVITDLNTFMIILWIFGALTGIGVGSLNYKYLRQNSKITHDHYAFNHSTGLISFYAFLYFALLGTIIMLVEDQDFDEEDSEIFGFFELKYRQRAWAYFLTEVVHFSGLFLSTIGEYYVLKHDLTKMLLIYFMIAQMVTYTFNLCYLVDFKVAYVVIILLFDIINIVLGIFLWIKYYSDAEPENTQNSGENAGNTGKLLTASNY